MKQNVEKFQGNNDGTELRYAEYNSPRVTVCSLHAQDVITSSVDFDVEWGEDWGE